MQEFLGQENGKSQPEDSESDKSTTSGETEWSRDLQYMHFSHSTNEPQRGDDDYNRLFKVHRIMYMVLSNLKHVYEPSKPMSIDKGMIAYKGHLSFRQFMPAKLTKYGVKGWMAANAKNGYISNFAVYLDQAEKNCHRIHGLGYDVVMKMTEFYQTNKGTFFSTIFHKFEASSIFGPKYACGTVRCKRKDLPPCEKQVKVGETWLQLNVVKLLLLSGTTRQ